MTAGRTTFFLLAMRSWSLGLSSTLGFVLLVGGCRPENGESWAAERLGADGASSLRAEAATLSGRGGNRDANILPASGAPEAPYLPRPFVVLSVVGEQNERLVYDAMNRELDPAIHGPGEVKGIVVLDKQQTSKRVRRGSEGHTEYFVTLIDRSTKSVTSARADRPEALANLLERLPARAP